MNCPKCGVENPDINKLCASCGSTMEANKEIGASPISKQKKPMPDSLLDKIIKFEERFPKRNKQPATKKSIMLIWFVLLASIPIYGFCGFLFSYETNKPAPPVALFITLSIISLIFFVISIYIFFSEFKSEKVVNFNNKQDATQILQTKAILGMVFGESISIFGLCMVRIGQPLIHFAPFAIVSFIAVFIYLFPILKSLKLIETLPDEAKEEESI